MTTLGIILLMLAFNAFFAAYEMAIASVTKSRLLVLKEQKKWGSQDALFMKTRMEASLAVIQLGITLVGAIAAAVGGARGDELLAPYLMDRLYLSEQAAEFITLVLVILPLSAFTIVFGELMPKVFALNNKESICLKFSPPMKILYILFYPPVYVLERIVKIMMSLGSRRVREGVVDTSHVHELKAIASMARTSQLIGARQEKIVNSAAELSSRPVKDIMIPAAHMSMIPSNLNLADAMIRAHLDMHTRFPVCTKDGDSQTIVGYVNFKDIIFALHVNPENPTLKGITRPIKSVQASKKNSAVLEEMIQDSAHIALVRNEVNKVVGMVTLEDLIEELVGEIQDEYDKLPTYVHPYLSGWVMGGGVSMEQVAQTTGHRSLPIRNSSNMNWTLSEWAKHLKGASPGIGEMLKFDGLTITVRKLRRKELSEALVMPEEKPKGGSI